MPHPRSPRAILLLSAALAGLWLFQFHPFVFPNNDFYSYRRAAWSLQDGELPRSTKRGPIFPAAIAALAPAMPGEQPELTAALAVNLACSLAFFVVLSAFAARTFPDTAPVFAALLATTPVLHAAALQPLLEPTLGLFVALAFLGLRARSAWQYGAAGAAALSRPDAIVLIAILAAVNALFERDRTLRHAALAAIAALPCLIWYASGSQRGGATYLALRDAYGSGAIAYLAVLPKEVFPGWWRPEAFWIAATALFVALPAAFGAWRAWSIAPRETGAMLAWFAGSCAIVVLYGVGKTRYVHPIAFVPLLCLAVGVIELARLVIRRLAASNGRGAVWLGVAATTVLGAAMYLGSSSLYDPELALAGEPDRGFAALAFLVLLFAARPSRERGIPASAAWAVALAITVPLATGGMARKRELVTAVYDFDRAAAAAAAWVQAELPPGERIAALHYSQIKFAAPAARERVFPFQHFQAATLDELRAALASEGVRYVAWTWRRAPETRAERFYAERRKEALAAAFGTGGPVPGFEHVATLPAEPRLRQPPAQIYRLH